MAGLVGFIKGLTDPDRNMPGCANYDHHYGGCFFAKFCKVEKGQRCAYFERVVLPTAGQLKDSYSILEEYQRQTFTFEPIKTKLITARFCICGNVLPPHKRLCDRCRRKKRRETDRVYKRKYRFSACHTEVENSPL